MNNIYIKKIFFFLSIFLIVLMLNSWKTNAYASEPDNLVTLLGKSVNSTDIQNFITSFNEKPETSKFIYDESLSQVYYSFPRNGIELLFENNVLTTIFLYAENHEGYNQYKGVIPNNIKFSDNRIQILKKLGPAAESGGGGKVYNLTVPFWDKWKFAGYALHISYNNKNKEKITLIEIMQDSIKKGN